MGMRLTEARTPLEFQAFVVDGHFGISGFDADSAFSGLTLLTVVMPFSNSYIYVVVLTLSVYDMYVPLLLACDCEMVTPIAVSALFTGVEINPNCPLAWGMSSPEKLLVPKKNH